MNETLCCLRKSVKLQTEVFIQTVLIALAHVTKS